MNLSALEKMYIYIKKNNCVSEDRIGAFIAGNPECVGVLDKLIQEGYVVVENGLYTVTQKEFKG